MDGAVARVFLKIVLLAMCPLKLSLAPYVLDSDAGTVSETRQSMILDVALVPPRGKLEET